MLLLTATEAQATTIIGLTDSNKLVLFDSATPENIIATTNITGLQSGESVLGIDFRPGTSKLYAVGSTSRLYRINPATGVAVPVSLGSFAPALNVSAESGFEVGFDFDPVQGWLRIVSNGQSLRLDPDSGTVVAIDSPLFNVTRDFQSHGQTSGVSGIAYRGNFPLGSTFGTLYGIDWKLNRLVTIGSPGGRPASPDRGEVFSVGQLFTSYGYPDFSVAATNKIGLDITLNGLAFASIALKDAPSSSLFIVNLTTGQTIPLGNVGTGGTFLRGIALTPEGTNLYAVTLSNKLLLFNATMPGAIIKSTPITGLQPGENILAIELRTAAGQLHAFSNTSRLYRIDLPTGAAIPIRPDPITPPLAGSEFSMARDTFRDQIRIVSDADETRQLGFGLFSDGFFQITTGNLAYASDDVNAGQNPKVVGLASTYDNSDRIGTLTSIYYGIDSDRDALVFEKQPDFGTLHTVGSLNVATNDFVGFDIGFDNYASLTPICFEGCPTPSTLFTIDLNTGRATLVGGIGGGEIIRDIVMAPLYTVQFARPTYTVEENCTSVTLTVIRTGGSEPVEFKTSSEGTLPYPPADERADYNAAHGTLRFAAGEPTATIQILINEDSYAERTNEHQGEAFKVFLTILPNRALIQGAGSTLESPSTATVLIVDDEDAPGDATNAIDDTSNFVCQQYHDFLNREPDPEGFNFWASNIYTCGDDVGCIEVKRIETSAAFFLSIEFQETGFFVYRMHQAAFGRTPAPLDFRQFLYDTRRVSEGVIIGQPGALERLEANKRAFTSEFINRPEFLARYPLIRPNEAQNFVDSLDANSGGVLSPSERAELIALYQGGAGRFTIIQRVVDDEDFKRLSFNRAFVLSQYFGYLRRNPNDPPDTDFSGYNFWLNKLNQFNGDFRAAEMVKAFINSGEYRRRFGAQ
jgi:hypothetical protein